MFEFLARVGAVILEDADVLDAGVALEILDTLRGETEELLDFGVAGRPKVAIVPGVLHQNFVRAYGTHAVVDAIAAACGIALNPVQR